MTLREMAELARSGQAMPHESNEPFVIGEILRADINGMIEHEENDDGRDSTDLSGSTG
jgi:hypothetical protein